MDKKQKQNEVQKDNNEVLVKMEFPGGRVFEQRLYLQKFKVNEGRGFQNSGYSLQGNFNEYKLNIVIIDNNKKVNL